MSAIERVPRPVWQLAAVVFLPAGALLPMLAWRLHLIRIVPAPLAGPAIAIAAAAALSWLAAGTFCLARSRRPHPRVSTQRGQIALGSLPYAQLR